jgi:periplasmic protein TonB
MSYKALLFCPEEKTGRTVTQVLSELEFEVQACNEPFAAVKKLTTEHFDAIVVDCENEQNAILLFKSARNSGSNQASLSIAVVEGQAGVAKAFRIGANLVLTKPINVEQSKGTIRVARGLLRKSESAKSAAPSTIEQPARPSVSAPAPSSVFELEAEPEAKPEPTEAALLESMADPSAGISRAPAADPSTGSSWPISRPMATALQDAAGATGHSEPAIASDSSATSWGSSVSSAGAAAAPARQKPAVAKESSHEIEVPSFATSIGKPRPSPSTETGGSRKAILVAAVALAVVAAGYFGWKKAHFHFGLNFLHKTASQAQVVRQPQAPAAAAPAPTPNPEPATIATAAPSQPSTEVSSAPSLPAHEQLPASTEAPAPKPKKNVSPIASSDVNVAAPKAKETDEPAAPDAIVVRGGREKSVQQPVISEAAPEPNAPAALSVGSESKNEAIAGLVNVAPSVPRAAPETLKVSQGVSQGLLVKKVAPIYPPQALQMKIQGAVQLLATISKDGDIRNVKALGGDAILARAAIEAVKQWKYKPYLLDSQPVEIQTQITVNFKLP